MGMNDTALTILHVEDDPILVKLVQAAFAGFGFRGRMISAGRVDEALDLLDRYARDRLPISLILVDMQLPDGVGLAGEINADGDAHRPDIEHIRQASKSHCGLCPRCLQFARTLEQPLVTVEIERGEAGRAGERMRRVGVAVEQLNDVFGSLHERVVDAFSHQCATHRHGA